ncbi:MAG TPA: hypothetical protein VNJ01_02450 [Bacteriovoracaceae bacterium]|nr:hypothetical protein [Bacteriovoracaceae bacterium]
MEFFWNVLVDKKEQASFTFKHPSFSDDPSPLNDAQFKPQIFSIENNEHVMMGLALFEHVTFNIELLPPCDLILIVDLDRKSWHFTLHVKGLLILHKD